MIWNLTKNSPINFQISFWRTRDIKSLAKPMPAERMVKLKRFGEVLFKNYVMAVARAFWRIERAYEIDVSINSQYVEEKQLQIPDWGAIGGWGRGVASARELGPRRSGNTLAIPGRQKSKKRSSSITEKLELDLGNR